MESAVEALPAAVAEWRDRGLPTPDLLLVAGSGLGIELGSAEATFPLQELLPFPVRAVIGHAHDVDVVRTEGGACIVYQRGRLHAYQGYSAHEVVFTIRLAALLGARYLVMSNAAGGIDPTSRPGDLRLIRDHINLSGLNPLRGELPEAWGTTFQDMVDAYCPRLRALALRAAAELDIPLTEGVYASVLGPSFETPAEVEMLHRAGADLVGMSTVLEVIAARHLGLACLCLSLVSNHAAGTSEGPVRHDEVLDVGRRAADVVRPLLTRVLQSALSVTDSG